MSSLKLTLGVEGTIGKFPITPIELIYDLADQTAATGPKAVSVPPNTNPGTLSVCMEPMSAQSLLLICADPSGSDVQYRLNGDGQDREVKAGSFAIHPGGPIVTKLEFGNDDTSKAAILTIFQLGLSGAVPGGGMLGGSFESENLGPATAAQTEFPLPSTPAKPENLIFFVDGVEWHASDVEVTVVTTGVGAPMVVWSGAGLAGGERILAVY
jgi:hypothetical protein